MVIKSFFKTAGWIVVFLAISYLIGEVTRQNMGWYDTLPKSPLNPPRIVFPIVWTTLYIMLAMAGARLWRDKNAPQGRVYFTLFAGYMAMNWAWSFIFFSAHMVLAGLVWIILSDVLLGTLVVVLWRNRQKIDMALLTPTLLWGVFAAYLNGYIYWAG